MRIVLLTAEQECAKCRETKALLARLVERFAAIELVVLKATDPAAACYGIVLSPTTILQETIIASGRVPNERKLVAYLETVLGE